MRTSIFMLTCWGLVGSWVFAAAADGALRCLPLSFPCNKTTPVLQTRLRRQRSLNGTVLTDIALPFSTAHDGSPQRTLALIKPDAYDKGPAILVDIADLGFSIVEVADLHLSPLTAGQFYEEHSQARGFVCSLRTSLNIRAASNFHSRFHECLPALA